MPDCVFDNLDLPTVVADLCNPETHFGQIQKFHFTKPTAPLTDASSLVEWTARLSNSAAATTSPAPIRTLHVIGQVPKPEQTKKTMSLQRTKHTVPKNSFTFKVDETDVENVNLAIRIQAKGSVTYAAWLLTADRLIGGNSGIVGQLSLYYVVPESEEELMYLEGLFEWTGVQAAIAASPFV